MEVSKPDGIIAWSPIQASVGRGTDLTIVRAHLPLPPFAAALTKLIPMANVLELVFTAEPITAQRAYEIGFVNQVVPTEQLLDAARALAQKLVANAPLSLRNFKEMAYRSVDMSEAETATLTMRLYDQLLRSEDAREGPRAFAEKRPPQWQGR